jgi:leucyl aminopeptidase
MMEFCRAEFGKRKGADLLVVPCWEGGELALANRPLATLVSEPLVLGDFRGKLGETSLLYLDGQPEKRALLIGLGKECDKQTIRKAYAHAIKRVRCLRLECLNVCLPKLKGIGLEETAHLVAEGLLMANEAFDDQKHDTIKEEPSVLVKCACLLGATPSQLERVQKTRTVIEAVYLARSLSNRNADDITPQRLAAEARKLGKQFPKITTTVFDKKRIEKEKMGLLLAVNRGSAHDPAFIIIDYKGNPRAKDKTVLIGKGITYDSGGLSLKPSAGMLTMRTDMSAAATVLGTLQAAASLDLKVNLTGVIPTTENCIDGRSYKVGDVYQAYTGTTVEIDNTDAEGRLVLAEALGYASRKLSPTRIIDLGTLTGAIVVGLGEGIAALYTDEEDLAKPLLHAGEETGERCWRMPLMNDYKKLLKSDIADCKNAGPRWGGSITCALFLQKFVGDVPWAHFDIAGTAYPDKAAELSPNRATGYGVRLLIDYLQKK